MAKKKQEVEIVEIPAIKTETFKVKVIGDTPLLIHRFGDKQKKQILDKQMQRANQGKGARDPEQEYEDAKYIVDGQDCIKAAAFRSAMVSAARQIKGVTMAELKGRFQVKGITDPNYVIINGSKAKMREDPVVINRNGELRYRPEYTKWNCELVIIYNKQVISKEQIFNLLNIAGFAVGVGDWRVECNGTNGMFHVG